MNRDVIEWLESPEGEAWSKSVHRKHGFPPLLMCLKDDTQITYKWIWSRV